jgi:carbamoyltransferase
VFTLGFGGSIHDYATAVADENRVVVAVEDERLTRKRYAENSTDPLQASFDYCVDVIPEVSSASVKKVANDTLVHCPLLSTLSPLWMNHHYAHAAASFYTSPFDEAAIIVADGAGSISRDCGSCHLRETTSLFHGRGNTITLLARIDGRKSCPAVQNDFDHLTEDSIGDLYEAVTCAIGFAPLREGKTMALSAFGDDRFVRAFNSRVTLHDGFSFSINLSGPDGLVEYLKGVCSGYPLSDTGAPPFDVSAALAYAAQFQVERLLGGLLIASKQYVQSDNLCFVGGVGLNAVAMGKLPNMGSFRSIHLISAPGDSGTAIGAALVPQVAAHRGLDAKRWPWTPYLGKTYEVSREDLHDGLLVQECPNDELLLSLICDALVSGKVVALFRGRSEFGPRALGHRSLLASAEHAGIQSKLNRLKSREWFRPVAPMTLAQGHPALLSGERWMQVARQSAGALFEARPALHVDGSARVQLIDEEADPFLRQLLLMLQSRDAGTVLNTSFNLLSEPIVETPQHALKAFLSAPIDVLAIDSFFVTKRQA